MLPICSYNSNLQVQRGGCLHFIITWGCATKIGHFFAMGLIFHEEIPSYHGSVCQNFPGSLAKISKNCHVFVAKLQEMGSYF